MVEERIYTINLRKDFIKVARWRRANRAIRFIKNFIKRHLKVEEVRIGKDLNEYVWYRSRENPPARVRVIVTKEDKKAIVNLFKPEEMRETKSEQQDVTPEKENKSKEEEEK